MINPQLLDYVRAQRAAGLTREAIIQALAQGGWTQQDVTEAFMALDGVQTPPPPPPAAAPVTPAPTTPVQPAAPRTIIPPPQPLQPVVTPPLERPKPAMSEFSTAPGVKKGHGLLYTLVFILVIVVAAGALVYLRPDLLNTVLGWAGVGSAPAADTAPEQAASSFSNEPIQIVPILDASSTASTTPQ